MILEYLEAFFGKSLGFDGYKGYTQWKDFYLYKDRDSMSASETSGYIQCMVVLRTSGFTRKLQAHM